jgi:SAM-dependent methyltransferase
VNDPFRFERILVTGARGYRTKQQEMPMTLDALRESVNRLISEATQLSALGAALEARVSGTPTDARLAPHVEAVLAAAGLGDGVGELAPGELAPVLAEIRSMMLHNLALLLPGTASPGWGHHDAAILQSTGDVSSGFAVALKQRIAPRLAGLMERLEAPDARFLDIGVGVASLSIQMARLWPSLRIVGVDVWAPSLALARDNVRRAGLADRIELREQAGGALPDTGVFDLAWVPAAFIPDQAIGGVIERAIRSLRPGGWLLYATGKPGADPLSDAVTRLRLAQFGGATGTLADAEQRLRAAGLSEVMTLPSPPTSMVALVAGRLAGGGK